MRFQRIIEAVYYSPWFITPEGYRTVRRIVDRRVFGIGAGAEVQGVELKDLVNPRDDFRVDENGIAHINIVGVLGKNLSPIEKSSGNTGYEQIQAELSGALNQHARGVMLWIDSPGGAMAGNAEIAEAVGEIPLPTLAFIDTLGASAAYNLAASTDFIVANMSATVGSIGCIIPWVDESAAWEQMGIAWQPITNDEGDLKGAGGGPSLSQAQRESLREYVNDAFAKFKGNILANRAVPDEAMRGQSFLAPRAMDSGLIDAIGDSVYAYNKLLSLTA